MESRPERPPVLTTRWSTAADAEGLALVHAAAWRYAYAGVIPDPGLARMIGRRGPSWWRRLHEGRGRALVATLATSGPELIGPDSMGATGLGSEAVVGYALIGRCRSGPGAEVQELYVRPDCQGLGFGSRLFATARAEMRARDLAPLTVWCLAGNAMGLAFYRALGGSETGRTLETVAGVRLEKLRFTWT